MQRSSDYNTTRKISWIERMNREVYRMFLIHLPTPRFLIGCCLPSAVGLTEAERRYFIWSNMCSATTRRSSVL
ncbi:hypothetical protein LINGRAHAP2_LOCUS2842 [Linum grandiflorum]